LSFSLAIIQYLVMGLLNYFSGGPSPVTASDEKKSVRALPAPWYSSQEMYELERRAIFSRKWQLITHSVRLANVGDYLKYEFAGFDIVLIKDRTGTINGFHNVCRHRAFPVVTEDKGNAKILSCRYHGWSYGLNGKLAKAPSYQDLPGFDKTQNSLFPIHVHIDVNGFIWVNLDGKAKPEIAWDDDFSGIDTQERLARIKFQEYKFDHEWQMDGPWNWKILADNYNECYHCPTSHPDIVAIADLEAYSVDVDRCSIIHNTASTPEQIAAGLQVAPTYFFPNASMNAS
jgi:phenylpropionate dioxygenase-like ring-hydroxylating dioxygenase large terminal subunit